MAERCPTCGGAVKIVGETTLHYEPDEREEIERLQKELDDCVRSHQKMNADYARALDVIEFYADPYTYFAIGFFPDPPCGAFMEDISDAGGEWGERPGKCARAFMESE